MRMLPVRVLGTQETSSHKWHNCAAKVAALLLDIVKLQVCMTAPDEVMQMCLDSAANRTQLSILMYY